MNNDTKCCDAPVNYDCISKSRLIRQIVKIDDIALSPKALNRILEKIQNQVPYNQVDYAELDEQIKEQEK